MTHESLQPAEREAPQSDFLRKIDAQEAKGKFLSVGLDPNIGKLPHKFTLENATPQAMAENVGGFLMEIVDCTSDIAGTYKLNSAFYEQLGPEGLRVLIELVSYIRRKDSGILVIDDAKRADIGNTNEAYTTAILDVVGADATTVHPYLGQEANIPFLNRKDKGFFVLARTSNKGAGEFQDLPVSVEGLNPKDRWYFENSGHKDEVPLYWIVSRRVSEYWNENGNCGLVVGATYPEELKYVRDLVGDMPILIPGIGTQGGDLEGSVKATGGRRMIINSSSGIIHASQESDFADRAREEAIKLHNSINVIRKSFLNE